ncbi:protein FAR1-RELATED SEQUENCE 3-like [Apium graveolens]|uniref:protein FAR1-RELATED SEQUENCE 3-like n=1 Tax=Apium graveolens TaxID=4045 RepID=UPI003D7BF4CF
MPFVPFTGVNHHYQSVLFGFALMRDELMATFEWVLGTWLEAVEGKAPLAIITDQDQGMAGAIQSQLPNTTHLLWSCTGLKEFVEGAQKALEKQFMREKEEDYNTRYKIRCMRLKISLEQHAASIYTKEMFKKFQDQLVEAAKYFVEKDRDRSLEDVEDTYYKSFGMSCRHIIVVLTKRCVAELPEHFVKRRWTRDPNRVDGVFPYHMPGDDAPSHDLTPTERFNHMTLLTMGFSHSCMASKEHYEYAVKVINRETEII